MSIVWGNFIKFFYGEEDLGVLTVTGGREGAPHFQPAIPAKGLTKALSRTYLLSSFLKLLKEGSGGRTFLEKFSPRKNPPNFHPAVQAPESRQHGENFRGAERRMSSYCRLSGGQASA